MIDLLDRIENDPFRIASQRARCFGDQSALGEAELLRALGCIERLPEAFPRTSVVDAPGGRITWHDYEHLLWELGESVRRILVVTRRLRASAPLWAVVERVSLTGGYGKGRESWVMLQGQYGGRGRVGTLLQLVRDPEVEGHALYALRLLKAPEAREDAVRLLNHRRAWVRKEARSYLAKLWPETHRHPAS